MLTARLSQQVPKTIRFIVPYPAGGGADLLMRVLTEQIGRNAGVATVVENRPGAAAVVGTEYVSRAPPDGGTVLIAANSLRPAHELRADRVACDLAASRRCQYRFTVLPNDDKTPAESIDSDYKSNT